jgi:hypothetical protein
MHNSSSFQRFGSFCTKFGLSLHFCQQWIRPLLIPALLVLEAIGCRSDAAMLVWKRSRNIILHLTTFKVPPLGSAFVTHAPHDERHVLRHDFLLPLDDARMPFVIMLFFALFENILIRRFCRHTPTGP